MVNEVATRAINPTVQCMLWGRAAGRCEFSGCNRPLGKSSVTQEKVNVAQKAHIYSFGDGGPRGNDGIKAEDINGFDNLMLLCHECHRKIDQYRDGGRYPVELLRQWKADHERRVALVTGIVTDKRSHVVLFGANIGDHSSPLHFDRTASVLFPDMFPAEDRAIELGMVNSSIRDRDEGYWQQEAKNLRNQYQRKIAERLAMGEIRHLSIFGLAPQPLLILLGSLLTDIPAARVFQLQREPPGWGWHPADMEEENGTFRVIEPNDHRGIPALVLSLSATITEDRIRAVLGSNVSIWRMSISRPHNDFMKSPRQLLAFRQAARRVLDSIKAVHGQDANLHVFPAMPVAAAVEFGRVHMPKADLSLRVYDQIRNAGFVQAVDIPLVKPLE